MNNDFNELLNKLYSFHRFGIKPGLDRTLKLSEKAGSPHKALKFIHIAGTNGKGSVASLLASILMENGYKVGLYTSPHIKKFNERIRINGQEISDLELYNFCEKYLNFAEANGNTFFEITSVLAFKYFADNNVDIAIIEAGMGGRSDSTNIITPLCSVITQVDWDHMEYLGDTIEKIAFEKAGIIKDNIPVVFNNLSQSSKEIIICETQKHNSNYIYADEINSVKFKSINNDFSMNFQYNSIDYILPCAGMHQIENLKTVFGVLKCIEKYFNIKELSYQKAFDNLAANTGLESRISIIKNDPLVITDVSHNPAAIKSLIETINLSPYKNNKWNFIFAVMKDKDFDEILSLIRQLTDKIIITQPKVERALDLTKLAKKCKEHNFSSITLFNNVKDAVYYALGQKGPTIITGSFYLIAEVPDISN